MYFGSALNTCYQPSIIASMCPIILGANSFLPLQLIGEEGAPIPASPTPTPASPEYELSFWHMYATQVEDNDDVVREPELSFSYLYVMDMDDDQGIAPATSAPRATPAPATTAIATPTRAAAASVTPAPATSISSTRGSLSPTDTTPPSSTIAATTLPTATATPSQLAIGPPSPTTVAPLSFKATSPPLLTATARPSRTATPPPPRTATSPPSSTATRPPSPITIATPSPIAPQLLSSTTTATPYPATTEPPWSTTTTPPSSTATGPLSPTGAAASPEPSSTPEAGDLPTDAPSSSLLQEVIGSAVGALFSLLALGALIITTIAALALGGDRDSGRQEGTSDRSGARAIKSASTRLPSATLAFVLVAQIQFLATLSLVDKAEGDTSLLFSFADNLRWVNLWPPASVAETFTPRSIIDKLEAMDQRDEAAGSTTNNINSAVFMGNFTLLTGLLLVIIFTHVAIASAVEAYWLTKERAKEEVARAQLQGIPFRDISVKPSSRRAEGSQPSAAGATSSGDDQAQDDDTDEEAIGTDVAGRRARLNLDKIVKCREKSQSALLHFPHLELVFLLFTFEGAVACQVSAIRENVSYISFSLAIAALLLYPVLMLVMVIRTFLVKVRPEDKVVFKAYARNEDEIQGGARSGVRSVLRNIPTFAANIRTSLKENHSMFAWADKGQWESVETTDNKKRQERNWFRIGFEPIFVDFTKNGSWFVVYMLVEWAALGVVGGIVHHSVLQLSVFCAMHALSFFILVVLEPFSNRIVNAMGAAMYGINATCMAVLAVSASKWEGSPRAERVDNAVMIIELVSLLALVIPIYVDTSFMMLGALKRKCRKTETVAQDEDHEREFTKRYLRRAWPRMWWTMLGKNLLAFFRDTGAGIRYSSTKYTVANSAATAPAGQRGPDI